MSSRTPIERAVATYCSAWSTSNADCSGISRVNPEALTSRTEPDFSFRYIDIGSVTKGVINWADVQTIQFHDAPSRARRVVRSGDTLICTVRPLLGSHASADWSTDDAMVCSTGFAVLRCCGDGLLPQFAKHLPFSEQASRQLAAWQCGTSYPAVNERDVRKLVLPLPPPQEQAAIARLLESLDVAIECARTAVEAARVVRRALLADLLTRGIGGDGYLRRHAHKDEFAVTPVGTVPVDWRLSTVACELALQTGITLNEARRGLRDQHRYLRVANVRRYDVDLTDVQQLGATDIELAPRRLQERDLLVVEGHANRREIGRCALVPPVAVGMTFQNHLFRLRTKGEIDPDFGCLWLNSEYAQRYWDARCGTSSGLNTINQRALRRLAVPVPEASEQRAIVRVAAAQRSHLDQLVASHTALTELKRGLLDELLTGRIRLGEPAVTAAS
jgi:type I restriction enzyme S subunit